MSNKADVVIAVGMRFDDRVTGRLSDYLTKAKVIHIDIDPAELNKNVKAEIPIVADAKSALRALLTEIEKKDRKAWLHQFREYDQTEYEKVIKKVIYPEKGQLKMSEVINKISEMTRGESVLVVDVGQHQMESARYYRFKQPRSWITSGGAGTMGFALPAAIGAKFGAPERQVIAIIGDGSVQMTIQELGTVMQEKLPVKIVILNNHYLGMVRQWQQLFFDHRYSFVNIQSPDYVQLAKAYSIPAQKVSERSDLEKSLRQMLDSKGPYVLEIDVEQEQNVFPMVPAGASVDEVRLE